MRSAGIPVLSYLFFAVFLQSFFPCFSQKIKTSSVVQKQDEINALADSFSYYHTLLEKYSQGKANYFRKGLGWQNGNHHGFCTMNHMVSFSGTDAGVYLFDERGAYVRAFSVSYTDKGQWVTYGRYFNDGFDKPRISVSQEKGQIVSMLIILEDSTVIQYSDKNIRVSYPGVKDVSFSLYYWHNEPTLNLTRGAEDILFDGGSNEEIKRQLINDILSDFPYLYFSQILNDAFREGVDIADGDNFVLYVIGWFRKQIGLPPVVFNQKLKSAAKNHAEYLINNGITRKMLGWDVEKTNLDDYLEIHDEVKGRRGFTGVTPSERTMYTGYGPNSGECASFGRLDLVSELIGYFHSIYHRRPFIDVRVFEVGHCLLADSRDELVTTGITSWGFNYSQESERYLIYPAHGSRMVPWVWSAVESPDPFPESDDGTGPPITISFTSSKYQKGRMALTDSLGNNIPLNFSSVFPEKDYFLEAVPERPLNPNSSYTISFSHGDLNDRFVFETAPLNPAEVIINRQIERLSGEVKLQGSRIDVSDMLALGNKKGNLTRKTINGHTWIYDDKYDFSIQVPFGWSIDKPNWQEIVLKKNSYSILFYLQPLYLNRNVDKVYDTYSKNITYKMESKTSFKTDILRGYKAVYSWQYDNSPMIYYLLYNDYSLIIYGYGVPEDIMDTMVYSLRKGSV